MIGLNSLFKLEIDGVLVNKHRIKRETKIKTFILVRCFYSFEENLLCHPPTHLVENLQSKDQQREDRSVSMVSISLVTMRATDADDVTASS